jgi:hypothetical protein
MAWHSRPLQPDDIEYQRSLPEPRYQPGQVVRSRVGTTGDSVVQMEVVGPVAWYAWHWKRRTWIYRLAIPNRRRGRWYLECELVSATA